jgi:D-threo-aldose 1-dehydrogenase
VIDYWGGINLTENEQDYVIVPKVTLGRTGLTSSKLGLGMAWWPRNVEFKNVVKVLETAFKVGIRHIDLAPLYGSEEIIGNALQHIGYPDDLVLSTKVCAYWDFDLDIEYYAYSPDAVRRSFERSLKRLKIDKFDIVHIHDTRAIDMPYVFAENGALSVLEGLKNEGAVNLIGMATKELDCLSYAVESGRIQAIQTFHSNTLLNRTASERLYPLASAHGVAILDSAPFAGYILATGPVENAKYNYFPAKQDVIDAVRRIESLCRFKGVSLQEAALAFALSNPYIGTLSISTSNPERIKEWTMALKCPLTRQDFAELLDAAGPSFPLAGTLLEERLQANG